MLGIDPRAARAAWTVFLLALLIAAAYAIREILAVFVIALLFGYLLSPLVGLVERFTPRRVSFTFALAIVYLILIGIIIGVGLTIGARLGDEANSLANQLPALLKNGHALDQIPVPSWLQPVRARIDQTIQHELNSGGTNVLPYVKSLGGHLISGAKYIVYIVLVPILAFFFLKDGRGMQEDIVNSLVDEPRKPVVRSILEDIDVLLGEYIRALVLLSISGFIATSMFLGITGAPYAVLLSVFSALGEFLPVVGPAGAGILVLVISALAGYAHPLWYLVFWIAFRMFQDYMLSPYVMGRGVKLNPMLVLFGVFAGDQIAGVVGMFLSVPVLATLRVVFVRLRRARARDLVGVQPPV
ncbi:MAG TPA: AI-2E family transporter [Bryobacteraceae bacterium]|nr:AI-2E family transporter [Bryobacteraceae bacterium]